MNIKCEIITPLLMHGNDGKTPELREQSFKGVMRFWFRAIYGNLGLKDLREKEAKIFGDTSQKSSFRMKIKKNSLNTDSFNPLPHKQSNFKVKGFSPEQTFEIEFLGKNLELVKKIFILSTILGGFGQRSRRGFGSIKILEVDNNKHEFEYSTEKIEELIKTINSEFSFNDRNFESKNEFPYIKSIKIGKEYKNYNDILKSIGIATHKYSCFGRANPRQASPIVVSVLKQDDSFYPILTTLNGRGCWKNLQNFKGEIL